MDLLSIFSSAGLGSIVGLVGSLLTKREERKNAQIQNSHEIELAKIELEKTKFNAEHEIKITELQSAIETKKGELDSFKEGLREQVKNYGIKFVDAIRGLMRPLITVYLLVIASVITFKIGVIVSDLILLIPMNF